MYILYADITQYRKRIYTENHIITTKAYKYTDSLPGTIPIKTHIGSIPGNLANCIKPTNIPQLKLTKTLQTIMEITLKVKTSPPYTIT